MEIILQIWTSDVVINSMIAIGSGILFSLAFGVLMATIGYFRDKRKLTK